MSGKKTFDMIKAIACHLHNSKKFDRVLDKVKIISAGDGNCCAEFTVAEEHQNLHDTLHGGFSATLVDLISTYALMTTGKGRPGASVDIHMSYLKTAKDGDEIVIEAKTIKTGSTLAFLEVTLINKKSRDIIVTGSHTKFIAK